MFRSQPSPVERAAPAVSRVGAPLEHIRATGRWCSVSLMRQRRNAVPAFVVVPRALGFLGLLLASGCLLSSLEVDPTMGLDASGGGGARDSSVERSRDGRAEGAFPEVDGLARADAEEDGADSDAADDADADASSGQFPEGRGGGGGSGRNTAGDASGGAGRVSQGGGAPSGGAQGAGGGPPSDGSTTFADGSNSAPSADASPDAAVSDAGRGADGSRSDGSAGASSDASKDAAKDAASDAKADTKIEASAGDAKKE